MVTETTAIQNETPQPVFSAEEILDIQNWVRQVPVSEHVVSYAVRLASATRPSVDSSPDFIKDQIKWGAGSRASQALILAGKARALLNGRYAVAIEDVQALAVPVLRHRMIPNFHAEAEGITSDSVIQRLLETIKE
jgi:MoxR-like ATPase